MPWVSLGPRLSLAGRGDGGGTGMLEGGVHKMLEGEKGQTRWHPTAFLVPQSFQ